MTSTRPDLGRLLGGMPALLTASPLPDQAVGDAFGAAMAAHKAGLTRIGFVAEPPK